MLQFHRFWEDWRKNIYVDHSFIFMRQWGPKKSQDNFTDIGNSNAITQRIELKKRFLKFSFFICLIDSLHLLNPKCIITTRFKLTFRSFDLKIFIGSHVEGILYFESNIRLQWKIRQSATLGQLWLGWSDILIQVCNHLLNTCNLIRQSQLKDYMQHSVWMKKIMLESFMASPNNLEIISWYTLKCNNQLFPFVSIKPWWFFLCQLYYCFFAYKLAI